MKQYKYKGYTIAKVLTPQGEVWYNVFRGDAKLNLTRDLTTLSKAKAFIEAQG